MNPTALTVYRWELRKLRFQKRTYLGLGAAVIVPILFALAVALRPGGPHEVAFGRYIHDTGFAIPLVLLLFGAIWMFPLITALVAGDIFASEDHNGTLKTILTRSLSRGQIFAGKTMAAGSYAILAILLNGVVAILAGGLGRLDLDTLGADLDARLRIGFQVVVPPRVGVRTGGRLRRFRARVSPRSRPLASCGRACSSTSSRSSPSPASAYSSRPSHATAPPPSWAHSWSRC